MVYAKLWRSPLPHARLRAIDTTAAASAPGVLAVLTAADLADCDRYFGPAYKDQPILAIDRVRLPASRWWRWWRTANGRQPQQSPS